MRFQYFRNDLWGMFRFNNFFIIAKYKEREKCPGTLLKLYYLDIDFECFISFSL